MIPSNIIQFWHDFDDMPDSIKEAMYITKKNNSNYLIIKADDSFMYKFIEKKYPKVVLDFYKLNKIPASRSDIARLMLLYEYGGFYIDVSMELQKKLDTICDNKSQIIVVKRDDKANYKKCPERANFINGFIAVEKKSEFIKFCIEKIFINMLNGTHNMHVNLATGPNIINQALIEYQHFKTQSLSFSSLINDLFIYRRVVGVNNSWLCAQYKGIIPPNIYKENRKYYQKIWFFKRMAIQISFDFIFIKK